MAGKHYTNQVRSARAEMIGKRISKERAITGLTQREIAEAVGISESGFMRIEHGYQEPKVEVLERIAAVLGKSLPVLLYGLDADQQAKAS